MENNKIISCGRGWKDIYEPVIQSIIDFDSLRVSADGKIGVKKVYTENGMLKFDVHNPNNMVQPIRNKMISASTESTRVCEYCGAKQDIGYTCFTIKKTCCERCFNLYVSKEHPTENWYPKKITK